MRIPRRGASHRERVRADLGSSFRVWRSVLPRFPFNWHHHHDCELTWIMRGQGMRLVGDGVAAFGDDDLCLIGPEVPHTWYSTGATVGPVSAWIVQFPAELFAGLVHGPEAQRLQELLTQARGGLHVAPSAVRTQALEELQRLTRDPSTAPRRLAQLLRVLLILAEDPAALRPLTHAEAVARPPPAVQQHVRAAIAYLHARWREPLRQRAVAQAAGLTPPALAQVFRRWMGRTVTEYLLELRLGAVQRALAESDTPIADIALASGFGTLAAFNRRFRQQTGMTPRAWRQAARGKA